MHRDVISFAKRKFQQTKVSQVRRKEMKNCKEVVIQFLKIFLTSEYKISCHTHFKEKQYVYPFKRYRT